MQSNELELLRDSHRAISALANDRLCIIKQIESREAIKQLEYSSLQKAYRILQEQAAGYLQALETIQGLCVQAKRGEL